jgi:hypothetical protein
MNGDKLTSTPEIAAYLTAHVVGIISVYLINPIIFAALVAAGQQAYIQAIALGMSLLTMIAVLFLFLITRRLFVGYPV